MVFAQARPRVKAPCRAANFRVRVVAGSYNHIVPNYDYVHQVLEEFPDAAVANPDEARVLYSHGGYTMLDIRSTIDVDKYGKIPIERAQEGGRPVCVPYQNAKRYFKDGQVVVDASPNPDFLVEVEHMFRDKTAKLIVMDFDGTVAVEALEMLYDQGYENIVGLQGGYKAWFRTWDNKLKRRNMGEYQEHSWGEGETSCGIHASGAGFENQDAQSADFWKSF